MEEKIKISLPKSVLDVLKKDCDSFNFRKADGTPNMNAFVNVLVNNFYEEFSADEDKLHDELNKALINVPSLHRDAVFEDVVKIIANKNGQRKEEKRSAIFAFKPVKSSEKAVVYIENVLLKNESLSSFYRRMFSAYAFRPQNEREKIVFKENLLLFNKAIKKNVQCCITTSTGAIVKNLSVYAVASAKDELFNYVLGVYDNNPVTLRVANISTVSLLPAKAIWSVANSVLFERQIRCGAQYPINVSDKEEVQVCLTKKGRELFGKIYLYRPTPTKIEGNVFYFDCSYNQIIHYFKRFGEDALILSPARLGIQMRNYYHYALKKYRSIYRFEDRR